MKDSLHHHYTLTSYLRHLHPRRLYTLPHFPERTLREGIHNPGLYPDHLSLSQIQILTTSLAEMVYLMMTTMSSSRLKKISSVKSRMQL